MRNIYRYRGAYGYFYENYTKLYYLQTRFYDPAIGRFLNADDTDYLNASGTTLGCNLYAYCENNCINKVDPNGSDAILLMSKKNGIGHMGVLFQRGNSWCYWYWGPSSFSMAFKYAGAAVLGSAVAVASGRLSYGVLYVASRDVKAAPALRLVAPKNYINKYTSLGTIRYYTRYYNFEYMLYLSGNYSAAYEYYDNLIKNRKSYNLLWRNCTQTTLQGLNKAKPNWRFEVAKCMISPIASFFYLRRVL